MAFKGFCSYSFCALLVSFMSCLPSTDSFELKFLNDSQSVTVENGVQSDLDFFLRDFASLNRHIRIIVQYRRSGGNFDKICQIEHSKTSGCDVNAISCKCVGEQSGSFRYRLKMTFTEQDSGGSLYFSIWNTNKDLSVTVNVVAAHVTGHPTKATTHRHVVMLESTSTPPPTTIRPTIIPSSTTTPTTTPPNVDVATAAATTHLVVDTPGSNLPDTENNNDNGDTDELQSGETGESSGSGFVAMNVITISFLMLASQWGLM